MGRGEALPGPTSDKSDYVIRGKGHARPCTILGTARDGLVCVDRAGRRLIRYLFPPTTLIKGVPSDWVKAKMAVEEEVRFLSNRHLIGI
jgi:hypothetical protein